MPDTEIKQLMKNLKEALNETLGHSARVDECIRSFHDAGYEPFLVIDATIGLARKGRPDGTERLAAAKVEDPVRLRITSEDAKFLKSLKISVDVEG
jgi:hypothetical protein